MTGLEPLAAVLLFAFLVWVIASPDRVAFPARAAVRAGSRAGGQAVAGSRAGQAVSRRFGQLAGSRAGRAAGAVSRSAGALAAGAGWVTGESWRAARQGWRDARADHADQRAYGEKSAWGDSAGILRGSLGRRRHGHVEPLGTRIGDAWHDIRSQIRPANDHNGFGCCGCGRATCDYVNPDNGETYCERCADRASGHGARLNLLRGDQRRPPHNHRPVEIKPDPSPDPDEGTAQKGKPPVTVAPAENVAALEAQNLSALRALASKMKDIQEAVTSVIPHAETSRRLPDSLTFDPGHEINQKIMAGAESAPDPDALRAYAEVCASTLRAVEATIAAVTEPIVATGVKGHTDNFTPS